MTSACGGVGKTSVAMGLAGSLAEGYQRVLYINASALERRADGGVLGKYLSLFQLQPLKNNVAVWAAYADSISRRISNRKWVGSEYLGLRTAESTADRRHNTFRLLVL